MDSVKLITVWSKRNFDSVTFDLIQYLPESLESKKVLFYS